VAGEPDREVDDRSIAEAEEVLGLSKKGNILGMDTSKGVTTYPRLSPIEEPFYLVRPRQVRC
jgi:hypothetical protein